MALDEVRLEGRLTNIEAMGARIEAAVVDLASRVAAQNGSIASLDSDLRKHETEHQVADAKADGRRELRKRDLAWVAGAAGLIPGIVAVIAALN